MKIKFLFILWIGVIILVFNFNCSLVSAEIEELNCSNEFFSNITPSFSLNIREKTPIINPGDPLELKIYISGYGGAKHNLTKLFVYFPIYLIDEYQRREWPIGNYNLIKVFDYFPLDYIPIDLTDTNRPNDIIGNYEFYPEKYNNTTINENLTYLDDHTGFSFKFPTFYFDHNESHGICKIYAEDLKYDHKASLIFTINTTRKHIYGDHKIDFILSYTDGNTTYQNNGEVRFHINGWWERWETLGLIASITIFGFLLDINISSILKKIKVDINNIYRVYIKNLLTRNKE